MSTYAYRQAAGIRQALLDRRELALIDVREEADFATAHPLFAVNLPLSKLELEVRRRIPRFTTPITVYDNGEGLAEIAVERLRTWGYQDVALLAEGLAGWRRSGGELFQDVNSASKAFGELVESVRHTPSLSAREVQALIDRRQEVVIVDARRFDEYQTMSIPGSISVPGGELVLRVESLTPSPQTPIIVNCAGRTRSIIGTQSLINAGVPNPVHALRNGTIGWTLAGQTLAHQQQRQYDPPPAPPASGPPRRRISPNGPGWQSSMKRRYNAGGSRATAPPSCLMSAAPRSTRRATIWQPERARRPAGAGDRSLRQRAGSADSVTG